MMKRILFTLALALMGANAFAQSITGRLADDSGQPVAYANVALYADTVLQTGTTTGEDGAYRLERNYVPCVKGGRAGLYDAVSKTVYYSQGSADFMAPPPANSVVGIAK